VVPDGRISKNWLETVEQYLSLFFFERIAACFASVSIPTQWPLFQHATRAVSPDKTQTFVFVLGQKTASAISA
jgi:hypothetical protein